MSEGRASRQERLILGVLMVGLYLVAASMVANSNLNILRRDIAPDPALATQVLALAVVTLVLSAGLAVRQFGWMGGARVIGPNLWSGLIVGFIAAMVTVMPIRANTPPGSGAWIVLAPIYVAALAFAWWFAQQAPWVEPQRPVARTVTTQAESGAPHSRAARMNSAAEWTMATALLMGTVLIFALLFAGVGWEDAGESVPAVDIIAEKGDQHQGHDAHSRGHGHGHDGGGPVEGGLGHCPGKQWRHLLKPRAAAGCSCKAARSLRPGVGVRS